MIDFEFIGSLVTEVGKSILKLKDFPYEAEGGKDRGAVQDLAARAHDIVSGGLRSRFPEIPIFSENQRDLDYSIRREWSRFWLVDPVNGIDGFLEARGEPTVNIALIEETTPVFGAIYVPLSAVLYVAVKAMGCWKIDSQGHRQLKVSAPPAGKAVRVVIDRTRPSPDALALLDLLPVPSVTLSRDGAVKFCALVDGEADFHPGLDVAAEWSTAAGCAIVTEAGGAMTDLDGEPLIYNKPDPTSCPFLAGPSLAWLKEMNVLDFKRKLAESAFEAPATSCR